MLATVVAAVLIVVVGGVLLAVRQQQKPAKGVTTDATADVIEFPVDADNVLTRDVIVFSVDLRVPGPDQRGDLTAAQALEACRTQGVGCDPLPEPLSIALASATSDTPAKINPDGTWAKENDNRLVWAIIWRSDCFDVGGPGLQVSGAPPTPPAVTHCDNLVLIDAHTGALAIDTSGSNPGR
ncbi:hypothetical protein ACXR2U_13165 [Jatrophihabitans sp. YIM 134969]